MRLRFDMLLRATRVGRGLAASPEGGRRRGGATLGRALAGWRS